MAERRAWGTSRALWLSVGAVLVVGVATTALSACDGWTPLEPFSRHAPSVDEAIARLEAKEFASARDLLIDYLGTGACSEDGIGLPALVRQRYDASFDLGLTLFHLGEKYGRPFGEEDPVAAGAGQPSTQGDGDEAARRDVEIACAQIITKAIANDAKVPAERRARAFYLSGNLEFLGGRYEEAVEQYDRSLLVVPGVPEETKTDGIGRDAAWNRAIALRRIEEEKKKDDEKKDDEKKDDEKKDDEKKDDEKKDDEKKDDEKKDDEKKDDEKKDDEKKDDEKKDDEKKDDEKKDDEKKEPKEIPAAADPQMGQILDELEQAPTYQEEDAKKRAAARRQRPVMEDK